MKYLSQCAYIFGFTMIGELLHALLPLPVPAAIYGLVLLFLALMTGLVKPEQVSAVGKFLIAIMGIFFVAPGVNLVDCWDLLSENLLAILFIIGLSTVIVFGIAGWVTQALNRRKHHG